MMPSVAAFVPLKGHSSRVPGKNLRDFHGRPLFHVILETLLKAETVEGIYIDTDSDEIAVSASSITGVTVLRREPELEGDDVSVNLLIDSFLRLAPDVDHVIQTHATNPLVQSATVDAAVRSYFEDPNHDSVFAVTRYQARFYDRDMHAINHDPTELIPTQELDPLFLENSNFYIFSRESFAVHKRRIGEHPAMFKMDSMQAIDIDEEHDFAFALAMSGMPGA
ncbi:MAG: acylneuraminate cytidylyltransferase family protein [Actinomycetia bacterium]|nr:acylneuraminate cytidylyltransferase family protein [Actinomycetes bacterium]